MTATIGKSGTGIGKSGTGMGVGKSGTGLALGGVLVLALAVLSTLLPIHALAGNNLLVTEHNGNYVLSLHAGDQVVVGSVSRSQLVDGYQAFKLYSAMEFNHEVAEYRPLIKGSGSGASGESNCDDGAGLLIKGSGSGASGESDCSDRAQLLIKGSGSGASGDSACDDGASLMIKGSGSGASGESDCGVGLLIKGSGSGASGESAGAFGHSIAAWGVAEIVVDDGGMQVLIHRAGDQGLDEFMVAFIKTATTGDESVLRADFVAEP